MLQVQKVGANLNTYPQVELSRIKKQAHAIRQQFELGTVYGNILTQLYINYNPSIQNIALFLEQAKGMFPHLNCGLASIYLKHSLGTGRVENGSYDGQGHTFLLLPQDNSRYYG